MRTCKKILSMMLCATIIVSGLTAPANARSGKAAIVSKKNIYSKTATGDAIESEQPDSTKEPEENVATSPAIIATEEPAVSNTTAPTVTATIEPTLVPTSIPTTAPSIVPTASADVSTNSAVTGSAIVKVGEEIISGNYIYIVEKEPTSNSKGEVKVKQVREEAITKKNLTVQESITKDGYEYLITGIGSKAFKTCTALKKVTIKKNVKYIGVRAFQGVSTLQQVNVKSTLEVIKKQAFAGCSSLRTITIPANVHTIGVKAFKNCTKLKAVIVKSKKITAIKAEAFKNTKSGCYLVLPSGKKSSYRNLLNSAKCKSIKLYVY